MFGVVDGAVLLGLGVFIVSVLVFLGVLAVEWRTMAARRRDGRPSRERVPYGGREATAAAPEQPESGKKTAAA
jgi:hypothetical protein